MRAINPVIKVAALTAMILGERRLRAKVRRAGFQLLP
jgi:hypothetical protein